MKIDKKNHLANRRPGLFTRPEEEANLEGPKAPKTHYTSDTRKRSPLIPELELGKVTPGTANQENSAPPQLRRPGPASGK